MTYLSQRPRLSFQSSLNPSCLSLFPIYTSLQEDFYNAWEEDIAVVNIFFGKETVMGEKRFIISIKPDFYFRIREEH